MRLFNFYKPGCLGCQALSDSLNNSPFNVIHIDIIENPVTAAKYSVMSVPMLVLVDTMGNELTRARSLNDIMKTYK